MHPQVAAVIPHPGVIGDDQLLVAIQVAVRRQDTTTRESRNRCSLPNIEPVGTVPVNVTRKVTVDTGKITGKEDIHVPVGIEIGGNGIS